MENSKESCTQEGIIRQDSRRETQVASVRPVENCQLSELLLLMRKIKVNLEQRCTSSHAWAARTNRLPV